MKKSPIYLTIYLTLKKDIHYENTEYASVKLNDEIIDTFTNGNAVKVAFPEWLQKRRIKNGIHTVIHNHPGNTSPLPSPKRFNCIY